MAAETRAEAVVTSFEVRRVLRKLIEPDLFDLPVLAFNEMSPTVRIEVVGQIMAPQAALESANPPPQEAAIHQGNTI